MSIVNLPRTAPMGVDAGGTLIRGLTELGETTVESANFDSFEKALREIFRRLGTPQTVVIGAAGVVNAKGNVSFTNRPEWPEFIPSKIEEELGCKIHVVNDMGIKVAGLANATVQTLRDGVPVMGGPTAAVTVSSGVGSAVADSSESGHSTWQPTNELEDAVLRELRKSHPGQQFFSVEELIGGNHFLTLYDTLRACGYELEHVGDQAYIEGCRRDDIGIGPFMSSGAIHGDEFCERFMKIVGSLLGQYLHNLAVSFLPTGGIYLTGGVMQPEVVQYLINRTSLLEMMTGGSTHNGLIGNIPIYLIEDDLLGVKGALILAGKI